MTSRGVAIGFIVGYLAALVISALSVAHSSRVSAAQRAICHYWHPCTKALQVAWCESRYDVYARNGQYLGLFQMGDYARSTYGHAWNAWAQAKAAHRYYLDAGWAPWECA